MGKIFSILFRRSGARQRAGVVCAACAAFVALAAILVATFAAQPMAAHATDAIKSIRIEYGGLSIKVDGLTIIPKDARGDTVLPFLYNDRTYLPIRAISNALRCDVDWDESASAVRITMPGSGVPIYGSPAKKNTAETISVEYDNISIFVNGKKIQMAEEPFLFKDSVYLPLRAVATALGCTVGYDDKTCVISIISPPPPPSGSPTVSPKITLTPTPPPTFTVKDLAINFGGTAVSLGQDISAATKILGDDYEYSEAESCAYIGTDNFYDYGDVTIATLPINGESISAIDVFKGEIKGANSKTITIKSSKSITIGSTLAQIEAAYGKDYTFDKTSGLLQFWAGEKKNAKTPQLYFTLNKNNVVIEFGIYDGKAAG